MFRQSNCSNPTFSKMPDFPVWVVLIITRQSETYKPLLLSANFKIGTIISPIRNVHQQALRIFFRKASTLSDYPLIGCPLK